ncbi:MAG: methyltransferase domain-containing protein [Pseudonocardiaceae bacterium]
MRGRSASDQDLRHARILDVGCGQGTQALLLARAGHEVAELDISVDLLSRFETAVATELPDVRTGGLMHGRGETAPKPSSRRSGRYRSVVGYRSRCVDLLR